MAPVRLGWSMVGPANLAVLGAAKCRRVGVGEIYYLAIMLSWVVGRGEHNQTGYWVCLSVGLSPRSSSGGPQHASGGNAVCRKLWVDLIFKSAFQL